MKYYYYNPFEKEMCETEENWCPIGDGFMVNFTGDFEDYQKNKDQYSLLGNTIVKEGEVILDVTESI